jgi:hypothetical protein
LEVAEKRIIELFEELWDSSDKKETTFEFVWKYIAVVSAFTPMLLNPPTYFYVYSILDS